MKRLGFIWIPLCFAACSLIDDNLSVCSEALLLDYELELHTELSMQLETELVMETEEPVRNALSNWLAPIFTDKAKDVDLRFFSVDTDELRRLIQEDINDNRTSYTFQLPKENYMHLGVANISENEQVHLSDAQHAQTMQLVVSERGDLPSFTTGVFTARMHMEIGDTSQQFDVRLYMATCAVAIVLDTTICDSLVSIGGWMSGAARSFSVRDSIYTYDGRQKLMFEEVPVNYAPAAVPHRMKQASNERPFVCVATSGFPTADEESWSISMTTTLTNDRHTTTTLKIGEPVRAGTLRLIRAHVDGEGAIQPDEDVDQEIGVSIELDWKQGSDHEIDLE